MIFQKLYALPLFYITAHYRRLRLFISCLNRQSRVAPLSELKLLKEIPNTPVPVDPRSYVLPLYAAVGNATVKSGEAIMALLNLRI